jgi:preprotein translocase subunit SecG
MSFLVGLLTFLLILVCLGLVLLVLVQIPKKDAGAGLAFGGGAADALFGAGAGNALTKITKWATVVFIVLTVLLGALEVKLNTGNTSVFEQGVEQQQSQQSTPQITTPPASAPSATTPAPQSPAMPLLSSTNAPMPVTTTNGK